MDKETVMKEERKEKIISRLAERMVDDMDLLDIIDWVKETIEFITNELQERGDKNISS